MAAPEAPAAPATDVEVEVVYGAGPGAVDRVVLRLAAGATLADALRASGVVERHGLDVATLRAGVWGRQQPMETALRDRDRVEVYRPLVVDPKEARRRRQRRSLPA